VRLKNEKQPAKQPIHNPKDLTPCKPDVSDARQQNRPPVQSFPKSGLRSRSGEDGFRELTAMSRKLTVYFAYSSILQDGAG
jgi:hypothetical protein